MKTKDARWWKLYKENEYLIDNFQNEKKYVEYIDMIYLGCNIDNKNLINSFNSFKEKLKEEKTKGKKRKKRRKNY